MPAMPATPAMPAQTCQRVPARARGAFTFVELMVVLVIGAVVATSVSASLGSLNNQRRSTVARQLQRDLAFARERALATGTNHWVAFDVTSDWYAVRMESTATPGYAAASTILDPATAMPMVVQLNREPFPGVDLVSASFAGASAVGFDALGRPLGTTGALLSSAGTITISGSITLTVEARSGRVTISP